MLVSENVLYDIEGPVNIGPLIGHLGLLYDIVVRLTVTLFVVELVRAEEPLSNLLCIEVGDDLFEGISEFRIDLCFAETGQKSAIIRRLLDKDSVPVKSASGDYLIQKQLSVQIPIPFPERRRVDLAEQRAPLLDSQLIML